MFDCVAGESDDETVRDTRARESVVSLPVRDADTESGQWEKVRCGVMVADPFGDALAVADGFRLESERVDDRLGECFGTVGDAVADGACVGDCDTDENRIRVALVM